MAQIATYAALLLMDSCGRKTLLLWSCIGMLISCIIIMAALNGVFDKMVALVAVNTYVIFFEIGLGPIPWLIVAEMFDAKYVASAMSIAGQLNWSCNFIVGLVFPYLVKYLGSYSFLPFTCALLALTFFVAFVSPGKHVKHYMFVALYRNVQFLNFFSPFNRTTNTGSGRSKSRNGKET